MPKLTKPDILALLSPVEFELTLPLRKQLEKLHLRTGPFYSMIHELEKDELIQSELEPDLTGRRGGRPAKKVRLTLRGVKEQKDPTALTLPRTETVSAWAYLLALVTIVSTVVLYYQVWREIDDITLPSAFAIGILIGLLLTFGVHEGVAAGMAAILIAVNAILGNLTALDSWGMTGIQQLNAGFGIALSTMTACVCKLLLRIRRHERAKTKARQLYAKSEGK